MTLFPFNLPGPQFLLFYALFSAAVLAIYAFYASRLGADAPAAKLAELTSDPYRIAVLRADADEALRVAVVNLVDRGLLKFEGDALQAAKSASLDFVRRPLDRAILQACAKPTSAARLRTDMHVANAVETYRHELEERGLLLDPVQLQRRAYAFIGVLLLLGGLVAARMVQALLRGQGNLVFLIILGFVAIWIANRLAEGKAGPAGRKAVHSLQTLTARVKRQIGSLRSGGATNEALLIAAVYGVHALPSSAFGFVDKVFPKPKSDSSGSSCGSGNSCGSGSSCGGGGGGCGGCGSG